MECDIWGTTSKYAVLVGDCAVGLLCCTSIPARVGRPFAELWEIAPPRVPGDIWGYYPIHHPLGAKIKLKKTILPIIDYG